MDVITLTIAGTCKALNLGATKVYSLISTGELTAVKVGRRTLITTQSIHALVQRSTVGEGT